MMKGVSAFFAGSMMGMAVGLMTKQPSRRTMSKVKRYGRRMATEIGSTLGNLF